MEDSPSPKFQEYEYGAVPPLALPVKLTSSGTVPEEGEGEQEAESDGVEGGSSGAGGSSSSSPSSGSSSCGNTLPLMVRLTFTF